MDIIAKIGYDRFIAAHQDNEFGLGTAGFCVKCGAEQSGVEPDARNYKCDECGSKSVMGTYVIMGAA